MRFWQRIGFVMLLIVVTNACVIFAPRDGVSQPQGQLFYTPELKKTHSTSRPAATPTINLAPTQALKSTSRPTRTPPFVSTPDESLKTLLEDYLQRHERAAETRHFVFYTQDDYMPVDLAHWKGLSEEIYTYVSDRLDADSPVKISVAFAPAQKEACPIRGLASSNDPPIIIIFADPGVSEVYLKAVLAHEVGHSISGQGFESGLPNDIALTEGLASWAAGKYWNAWKGVSSIDQLVNQYIDAGKYLPLHENVDLPEVYLWQEGTGEGCLARRDQIYSEWASFVGYIIDQYGWDKAHQLFESGDTEGEGQQKIEHPTDYQEVLGKDLIELEAEWLDSVIWKMRIEI